jgi:hypothetical protein
MLMRPAVTWAGGGIDPHQDVVVIDRVEGAFLDKSPMRPTDSAGPSACGKTPRDKSTMPKLALPSAVIVVA